MRLLEEPTRKRLLRTSPVLVWLRNSRFGSALVSVGRHVITTLRQMLRTPVCWIIRMLPGTVTHCSIGAPTVGIISGTTLPNRVIRSDLHPAPAPPPDGPI